MEDIGRDNVRMQEKSNAGEAKPADFFHHHRTVAEIDTGTAVFLWNIGAKQAQLGGLGPELTADLAVLLPLAVVGNGFMLKKAGDSVTKLVVVTVEERARDHLGAPVLSIRAQCRGVPALPQ
jgi:hypothetical protein